MEIASTFSVYRPRKPKQTPLWKILWDHFEEFEQNYDRCFVKQFGFFRAVIARVVRKYLECGDLHKGFARVRCPNCHHEYLLAFSCRGRWFCPSCHAKKVVQFGAHLQANILYPVPHRQYVFSMPKILRLFFKYNRKLLGKLCQCAQKSLVTFFQQVLRKNKGIAGSIVAIQTFGDYCRWHPHLHAIVSDGLYTDTGYFYVMPRRISIQPLREIFRANVLAMLKKEGLIDDDFIRMIMKWRHTSGFSVHNKVRIARDDGKGQEALAQYIIRNPFSLKKLQYQAEKGKVIYRSKMSHGKNKKNFEVFNALDFIATITQHIPEQSFQLVRYYGWYSNRMRGDRKKREQEKGKGAAEIAPGIEIIDISEYQPVRIPSPLWRDCTPRAFASRAYKENMGG